MQIYDKGRDLVLKKVRGYLVICDKESGQMLASQKSVQIDSFAGETPEVIVKFHLASDGITLSPD